VENLTIIPVTVNRVFSIIWWVSKCVDFGWVTRIIICIY